MKRLKAVPVLAASALLLLSEWTISAFAPLAAVNHCHRDGMQQLSPKLTTCQNDRCIPFVGERSHHVRLTICQLAADDDDEDEDDDDDEEEEKGPLSKGIDSVSWLPSVVGGKGDNMQVSSVKEVRHVLIFVHNRLLRLFNNILTRFSSLFVLGSSN